MTVPGPSMITVLTLPRPVAVPSTCMERATLTETVTVELSARQTAEASARITSVRQIIKTTTRRRNLITPTTQPLLVSAAVGRVPIGRIDEALEAAGRRNRLSRGESEVPIV